jgi:hypothetical protein
MAVQALRKINRSAVGNERTVNSGAELWIARLAAMIMIFFSGWQRCALPA